MDPVTPKGDIGVIVGRFQVHLLTFGHREFIRMVRSKHNKVIVFLGVAESAPTKRNPLDFASRKLMLEAEFPDIIVLPLKDNKSDHIWSSDLDRKIREVFPTGKPILYGNRDSFVSSYHGSFETVVFEPDTIESGTDLRKEVSNKILGDPMFRAGVIYSVSNRFPISYQCVDIATFSRDGKQILLGQKTGETKYRFIGGFVDPRDKSLEDAAMREFREETGGTIGCLTYLGSFRIDDWRYRRTEDAIMTAFFTAKLLSGPVQPSDDIDVLKWFDLDKIDPTQIVEGHLKLMDKVVTEYNLKYYFPTNEMVTDYAS